MSDRKPTAEERKEAESLSAQTGPFDPGLPNTRLTIHPNEDVILGLIMQRNDARDRVAEIENQRSTNVYKLLKTCARLRDERNDARAARESAERHFDRVCGERNAWRADAERLYKAIEHEREHRMAGWIRPVTPFTERAIAAHDKLKEETK